LDKLLFELASSERMAMLRQLKSGRARLTGVAKIQKMSAAEATRHLQRLAEAKLVERGTDGLYGITPFGTVVLTELSGLEFVSRNKEYFANHDASRLPREFTERLGEFAEDRFVASVLGSLDNVDRTIREAQDYIWILTDQIFKSVTPVLAQKTMMVSDVRLIAPVSVIPPDSKAPIPSTTSGVQKRVLKSVEVCVLVTEKYGAFALPNRRGQMDYTGIGGSDPGTIAWCKDLFLHYWEMAKPFRG
jgi:predicted transcriptional regulator